MMIKTGEIANRIYDLLVSRAEKLLVEEVRIGLGYVGMRLEGNRIGLAAVLKAELASGCSVLDNAGCLTGLKSSMFLKGLTEGKNPLEKALGLAAANALFSPSISSSVFEQERDIVEMINLTSQDRVAMIGLFKPLVSRIKQRGAILSIIERDTSLGKISDQKSRAKIFKECTVALITATSLLNNTIEEVLNGLEDPRHVVILGPSTPLCADIFQGTLVSYLGGSVVLDTGKAMQIISEGGGTRQLRPYLRFVNIRLRSSGSHHQE